LLVQYPYLKTTYNSVPFSKIIPLFIQSHFFSMFLSKLERSFGPSCPPLALPMVKQKKKEKKKKKKRRGNGSGMGP